MRIRLYRFFSQLDNTTLLIKSCTWEEAEELLQELRVKHRFPVLVENYSKAERQPKLNFFSEVNDGKTEG